jgi:hypothetical protein
MLVYKLKTKKEQEPIPELDEKIAMLSFHSPLIERKNEARLWPGLMMWTLIDDNKELKPDLEWFLDYMGEDVERYVEADCNFFNNAMKNKRIEERFLEKVIRIDDMVFAEFYETHRSKALVLFGTKQVKKGWKMLRGQKGWIYKEMGLSYNVTQKIMEKDFNLTKEQAKRFMKEYRLQKNRRRK